jgi:osmotically inducible protein OsmC
MAVRKSAARREGSLREGHGSMTLGIGAFKGDYSFLSGFEIEQGTHRVRG